MGGACSARPAATPDTSEPPPSRHVVDVRPEIPQRPKRDSPPAAVASLVDLCVNSLCLHLDRFQVPGFQLDLMGRAPVGDLLPLSLPFELSQRVLSRLVDRAWLDYVALGRLSGCVLAAIELPDCAHLQDEWIELIMVHHGRTLARVDLSGCPHLSDAGVAHLSTCKKLRELNLSRCARLTDKALAALRGLPLEQLRLEQPNLAPYSFGSPAHTPSIPSEGLLN